MTDTVACGKEVDTMLLGKLLDLLVLLYIARALVLHIMIEGKDKLGGILDLGSAGRHEPHGHGPGIIMCETSVRLDLDIVTSSDDLAFGKTDGIAL